MSQARRRNWLCGELENLRGRCVESMLAPARPELQQLRVREAVDSMVKSLERENIRKMQGLMLRCSAGCCEDSQAARQQVQQCMERCRAPPAPAQALVTSELEKLQDHLAQCTVHCNDKAEGSIDAGRKELQVQQQLESCVTKCVDDHMNLIPTMTRKMKESLSSMQKYKSLPLAIRAEGRNLFKKNENWSFKQS